MNYRGRGLVTRRISSHLRQIECSTCCGRRPHPRSVVLLAILAALTACRSPLSFPTERQPLPHARAAAEDWSRRVEILQERGQSIRTLSGVVQVATDSRDMSVALDIIMVYESSGRVRFQGVQGLRTTARPLFDLTFAGGRSLLRRYKDGVATTEIVGRLDDFPTAHPELQGLYWVRDLLFFPARHARSASAGSCPSAGTEGTTPGGSLVRYKLDCDTLAILEVSTTRPGLDIWYDDYRVVEGSESYLPHRVIVRDHRGHYRMDAVVVEAEVNAELPEGVFDIPEKND